MKLMLKSCPAIVILMLATLTAYSQKDSSLNLKPTANNANWAEKIKVSGYAQVRYNGLIQSNENLTCEQCDKSWGGPNQFFLRRMRLKFTGQVHERVYLYFQADFASNSTSDNLHFGQIRDAYFDVGLDKNNEYRIRFGQGKLIYGFENMQSSQNRLPLDRNDALNSAFSNERDLGVSFLWAPKATRKLYSSLIRDGLKGSGDYGVFGITVFNGQNANKPELNNNKHVAMRFSYPLSIGNQIIEPGVQAFTGQYQIAKDKLSTGVKAPTNLDFIDQRAAASFVLYPKPFGIQAEYNVGRGAEFNKSTDSIEVQALHGGYATLCFKKQFKGQIFYPFVRAHYYEGTKKHEQDARSYSVKELEIGLEWLPFRNFELVAQYTFSNRRYEDFKNQNNYQKGNLLRLQAQINF
jgi:hypothetical protein